MNRAPLPVLLLLVAAALAGCGDAPPPFRLVEALPAPGAGPLRLNERIVLVFDRELDPSSVTPAAVEVLRGDGTPAPGRLVVRGAVVSFVPRTVTAPTLDDGGYPPGGTVRVRLRAFPARTGLLSTAGDPLAAPRELTYAVVTPDPEHPGLAFVDVDRTPPRLIDGPDPAANGYARVRPDGWVRLRFTEPLLPGSVTERAIRLRYDNPDRTPVPLELVLDQDETSAAVLLRPKEGFGLDTRYLLDVGEPGVQDLAGHEQEGTLTRALRVDPAGEAVVGGGAAPHEEAR